MTEPTETPKSAGRNSNLVLGAILVWLVTGAVAIAALTGARPSSPPPAGSPAGAPTAAAPVPTQMLWANSFEEAMQRSRNENRPVMVDFYTDWCGACKYLDANVYSRSDVMAATSGWIIVKVNAEQRRDVAGQYGVTAYPTIAFLRGDGQPIDYYVGAPAAGELIGKMNSISASYTAPSAS